MAAVRGACVNRLHPGLLAGATIAVPILMACGSTPRQAAVVVIGSDYAYTVSDTIPPGPTAFSLQNGGVVDHEMGIARLKAGVTLAQVWETMQTGGNPEALLEDTLGIVFARPGQGSSGRLLVDLVEGSTYILMCFLQDAPDDPPHNALGMMDSFYVPET